MKKLEQRNDLEPRIGIYGSVPKNSEIFQIITAILGYDPFARKEAAADKIIAPFCGRAKTFGAHFTIYDIFTPTNYNTVVNKIRALAKNFEPFDFVFRRFSGYVRGDYQNKSVYNEKLKTVIALDFDSKSIMRLKKIHANIVRNIQPFRSRIEPEFDKEIFKNVPGLWKLIKKYGTPYVFENYSPHLTLAFGLDGSSKLWKNLIKYLDSTYGKKILNIKIPFDKIYIFEEITEGNLKGYFKIKDEVLLG